MSNSEVLSSVQQGYRHPKPHLCNDAVYELMLACWAKTPEERPSFEQLLDEFEDMEESQQYVKSALPDNEEE